MLELRRFVDRNGNQYLSEAGVVYQEDLIVGIIVDKFLYCTQIFGVPADKTVSYDHRKAVDELLSGGAVDPYELVLRFLVPAFLLPFVDVWLYDTFGIKREIFAFTAVMVSAAVYKAPLVVLLYRGQSVDERPYLLVLERDDHGTAPVEETPFPVLTCAGKFF